MKEIHKYCVRTNGTLILRHIQLSGQAVSIQEMGDYAGEEGLWLKAEGTHGRKRYCSRCKASDRLPARYCRYCGSRNREVDE